MNSQNVFLMIATLALCALAPAPSANSAEPSEGLVYELRTYTANPGKMADLHARFRDHTMKIFEKHGIKNIGYWIPTDKPDTLIYIVAHKSKEAAEKSWKAFKDDPEWQQVYKESHKNGVLVKKVVSVYMTPTDYSPIK